MSEMQLREELECMREDRNRFMDMCCLYEHQLDQCLRLLALHDIDFPACLKEGVKR